MIENLEILEARVVDCMDLAILLKCENLPFCGARLKPLR